MSVHNFASHHPVKTKSSALVVRQLFRSGGQRGAVVVWALDFQRRHGVIRRPTWTWRPKNPLARTCPCPLSFLPPSSRVGVAISEQGGALTRSPRPYAKPSPPRRHITWMPGHGRLLQLRVRRLPFRMIESPRPLPNCPSHYFISRSKKPATGANPKKRP